MPLVTGAMGARRYRVVAELGEFFRDRLVDHLHEESFREPPSAARGGENLGWVCLQNLCDTEFTVPKVFFNQYACWSLRIDNKRLPAKLVRALLELRMAAWLEETGREKVPATVKSEMREQLELELFPRQLPSVAVHDICWDLDAETVWFFSNSNKANEHFRLLFAKTFGADTRPIGPLDLIAAHPLAEAWVPALDLVGHSDYRPQEEL